jgi:hypothetical protein
MELDGLDLVPTAYGIQRARRREGEATFVAPPSLTRPLSFRSTRHLLGRSSRTGGVRR